MTTHTTGNATPSLTCKASSNYNPKQDGCTWLDANAADLLRAGESTLLRICVMRKNRDGSRSPYVEIYLCQWDAARSEWTLTRDDCGDGSGSGFKTYHISLDFGECTCPDANSWRGVEHRCKHVRGMTAALKAINVPAVRGPIAPAVKAS